MKYFKMVYNATNARAMMDIKMTNNNNDSTWTTFTLMVIYRINHKFFFLLPFPFSFFFPLSLFFLSLPSLLICYLLLRQFPLIFFLINSKMTYIHLYLSRFFIFDSIFLIFMISICLLFWFKVLLITLRHLFRRNFTDEKNDKLLIENCHVYLFLFITVMFMEVNFSQKEWM